ncbi:MAG: MFS transporter [Streptosporangiales bacterium]|nr:MFS transporter [Streptosporangiales bacterium]
MQYAQSRRSLGPVDGIQYGEIAVQPHQGGDPVQYLRDWNGRTYRVGESAERLTGHSRGYLLLSAAVAMAGAGALQYGYGAAVPAIAEMRGWSTGGVLAVLAVWTVFQAGTAFPTALLRERGALSPRHALLAGAACCLAGPLALAYAPGALLAGAGYAVLGGIGAGLVYATCTCTVAKWFPERKATRVGQITGAFGYGCVPLAAAFVLAPGSTGSLLVLMGLLAAGSVLAAALILRDPPTDWWPEHIDPRSWAASKKLNPELAGNAPAVRQYTAAETVASPPFPAIYTVLVIASAVSIFNAAYLTTYALGHGLAPLAVTVAIVLLIAGNGGGRALAMAISDRLGRTRTLAYVLALLGAGQLMLAAAESPAAMAAAAAVAGLGGGAFYPLFAQLAREYFGERGTDTNHALVYSGKAVAGPLGIVFAAVAVPQWGTTAAFAPAGLLVLAAAVAVRSLRQPGRPQTLAGR